MKTLEPRTRLKAIDGLRALAALYVVGHHTMLQFWPVWGTRPSDRLILAVTGMLLYGRFAVAVFIVISGFCLMMPLVPTLGRLKGGVRDFIISRLLRIVPAYYASIIFSLLILFAVKHEVLGTPWDGSERLTTGGVVAHFLLMEDILAPQVGGQINGVYWSIALEWHIYCLFPLLLYTWRLGIRVFSLVLVCVAIAGTILSTRYGYLHFHYLALFGLGMIAAQTAFSPGQTTTKAKDPVPWGMLTGLAAIAAVACCHYLPITAPAFAMTLLDGAWGLAAAVSLVAIVRAPDSSWPRFATFGPFVWIGKFSYSLYLIHAPLLLAAWVLLNRFTHLDANHGFLLCVAFGVPAILVLAYLFYRAFERPWQRRGSGKLLPESDALSRSRRVSA